MRVPLPLVFSVSLSIPAALLVLACSDGAATSPATTARAHASSSIVGAPAVRASDQASVVIPAPGGFSPQVLSRSSFIDTIDVKFKVKMGQTMVANVSDPSDVVVGKITILPGGALPWHTHPGPVIVSVASGTLTVVRAEGCTVHEYPAGKGLVDLGGGMVHVAFNPGATETVLYATYLAVPKGQPTLTPVPNPGC